MSVYDEANNLWHPLDQYQQPSDDPIKSTGEHFLNLFSVHGSKVAQVTRNTLENLSFSNYNFLLSFFRVILTKMIA